MSLTDIDEAVAAILAAYAAGSRLRPRSAMLGETREGNMLFSFTATEWVEVIAAATLPLTVIGCLLQTSARGAALTNRSI